jgi:hypothetical protein
MRFGALSGPELVGLVLVRALEPKLSGFAILHVPDMTRLFVERLAGSVSLCPDQRDGVLVIGQDVVDLDPVRPAGQFEDPSEKLLHLLMALVVAGVCGALLRQ